MDAVTGKKVEKKAKAVKEGEWSILNEDADCADENEGLDGEEQEDDERPPYEDPQILQGWVDKLKDHVAEVEM